MGNLLGGGLIWYGDIDILCLYCLPSKMLSGKVNL